MRIAVISDIHGNYKALEACLNYLEKHPVDAFFLLGDYITDGPYPQKMMKMLYELINNNTCYFVKGNREQYILDNYEKPQGWRKASGSGALLYTAENLKEEDYIFFKNCPVLLRLPDEKADKTYAELFPATTICHGIPEDMRGNLGENPELLDEAIRQAKTPFLFGGHSHKQELRQNEDGIYINPGSLGQAIDHVGKRAQFAIVETDGEKYDVSFQSISYDIEGLFRDFKQSGLEDYGKIQIQSVKKTLLTGENYFFECIKLVTKLSGGRNSNEIPENIWEEAARRLELF